MKTTTKKQPSAFTKPSLDKFDNLGPLAAIAAIALVTINLFAYNFANENRANTTRSIQKTVLQELPITTVDVDLNQL